MNTAVALSLVLSFAVFVVTHVTLVLKLTRERPGARALLALIPFLAPLAPYWGLEAALTRLTWTWIAAFTLYAVSLVAGYFVGH